MPAVKLVTTITCGIIQSNFERNPYRNETQKYGEFYQWRHGAVGSIPTGKCLQMTFILTQKYHAPVSNMLSSPPKCFIENEH